MKARRLQRRPSLLETALAAKGTALAGPGDRIVARADGESPPEARGHGAKPGMGIGIRRKKVARAKRLIADENYPPGVVLQKVAEKLLRKVKSWGVGATGRKN